MNFMKQSFPSFDGLFFEQTGRNVIYANFLDEKRRDPIQASGVSDGHIQMLINLTALFSEKPNGYSLILLDEPTAGLDPNQLIEIRGLIQSLSKDAMILFSSHILQEVAAITDRVLVLHQGKLVANQSIASLTQSSQHNLLVQFQEDITVHLQPIQLKYKLLEQPDKHALVIQAKDALQLDQARQYIMALALEKGLHIERLQTQAASLEEIFKLLTH